MDNTDRMIRFVMIDKNTRVDAGRVFGITAGAVSLRLKNTINNYINETGVAGFIHAKCTENQAIKLFYYYFDRRVWVPEFHRSAHSYIDLNNEFAVENISFNRLCDKDALKYIKDLSLLFKGVK